MIPEKVKNILKKLDRHGEAYLVGGCVRDMLQGKEPEDYDITTNISPDRVLSLFPEGRYVGEAFGVVLVDNFEIATFRKDVYSPMKKDLEKVEFVGSLEEDLSRRDFTINAMAMKLNGEVIDLFGGQIDLSAHLIRFVGNPDERIEEDPIRMVRGCRFLGNVHGILEGSTYNAILRNVTKIQRVSNERIRIELLKMMKLDFLKATFDNLYHTDLMKYILFPLHNCYGIDQNKYHDEDVYIHNLFSANVISKKYPLLRIAMLLHDVGKPAVKNKGTDGEFHFNDHDKVSEKIARDLLITLKFSGKEVNYICDIIKNHMFSFDNNAKKSSIKRFMNRINVPVNDMIRAKLADRKANFKIKGENALSYKKYLRKVKQIIVEEDALKVTDLAIGGQDLIELGFEPGPLFSEILNDCLYIVVEEEIVNCVDSLVEYVMEKYKGEIKNE